MQPNVRARRRTKLCTKAPSNAVNEQRVALMIQLGEHRAQLQTAAAGMLFLHDFSGVREQHGISGVDRRMAGWPAHKRAREFE